MKKTIIFGVALWLGPFLVSIAQPQHIHLSWNRVVKEATATTVTVTWTTPVAGKGQVHYGPDERLARAQGAAQSYSDAAGVYVHTVTLENLQPGTTYYYQCRNDPGGTGPMYRFQTGQKAGSQQKFVVGVWGDTQDNEFNTRFEKTDSIVRQMVKYPLKFTIHTGDIVNNGAQVASWKNLFATTQPLNAIAPFMPVPGNHDVDNQLSDAGFQMPFPVFYDLLNLPGKQDLDYSFNYGNAHFVAINSGHAKGVEEAHATNWRYAADSPEYQWLDQDLAQARRDKNITWLVVYMHHPAYSFGWSHVQGWQERIAPLLDKHRVDLALAGHRHVYERHAAIRADQPIPLTDPHAYDRPAGTVYITNGTAGGSPQGLGGSDLPTMVFTSPVRMYNYAVMTIEANQLLYEVYDLRGVKIDFFTLRK